MSSKSTQPSHDDSPRPDRPAQPGALTDAQRNFATVVGEALADAWRRYLQQSGHHDGSSEGAK